MTDRDLGWARPNIWNMVVIRGDGLQYGIFVACATDIYIYTYHNLILTSYFLKYVFKVHFFSICGVKHIFWSHSLIFESADVSLDF